MRFYYSVSQCWRQRLKCQEAKLDIPSPHLFLLLQSLNQKSLSSGANQQKYYTTLLALSLSLSLFSFLFLSRNNGSRRSHKTSNFENTEKSYRARARLFCPRQKSFFYFHEKKPVWFNCFRSRTIKVCPYIPLSPLLLCHFVCSLSPLYFSPRA